jgi:hypothetical protein
LRNSTRSLWASARSSRTRKRQAIIFKYKKKTRNIPFFKNIFLPVSRPIQLRQFEKRTQQQQQQKKISGLGKRRKKSSSQSALALCKGSRSNSLSTVGPAELDTAADNQQKSALELNW